MAVALGLAKESEPYPNTSALSPHLHGNVGLLFSPRSPLGVIEYFAAFQPEDYARSGTIASRTFIIPKGTIHTRAGEIAQEEDVPLSHSIEPALRKLGVPSKLVKGKIELDSAFPVCQKGDVLGSAQTSLLKIFGITTARFVVEIQAYYDRERGLVKVLHGELKARGDQAEDIDMDGEDFDGFEE